MDLITKKQEKSTKNKYQKNSDIKILLIKWLKISLNTTIIV